MFRLLWDMIASIFMGFGMRAEIPDDRCVACESEDVEILSEGVYCCNQCGYEGGSGRKRLKQQKRRQALDAISGAERQRRIRSNFVEVCRIVTSSLGDVAAGRNEQALSAASMLVGGRYDSQSGTQDLFDPMQLLKEAHGLLEEFVYMMGLDVSSELQEIMKHFQSRRGHVWNIGQLNRWAKLIAHWADHHLAEEPVT